MSRQSDNSKAGSEGNGDSKLSSYQNSPRKTPEFGSAGPFGDRCVENKSPNCFILMMSNDTSPESDVQQTSDLKAEYLERLNLIRQKLADIDIASYESYYDNCYGYSSSYSPRCQITEIFDESPKDTDNKSIPNKDGGTVTKQLDEAPNSIEATVNEGDKDNLGPGENHFQKESMKIDTESKKIDDIMSSTRNFLEKRKEIPENLDCKFENEILEENITSVKERNFEDMGIKCDANVETINVNSELKTIFQYDNPYNVESSVDLVDLNYNPPKKKYCVRESTPKLTMSEGAMSLPYHIRVSLHSDKLRSTSHRLDRSAPNEPVNTENKEKTNFENLEHRLGAVTNLGEEKNNHIFPEVQVDCFGGGDQEKNADKPLEGMRMFMDKQVGADSPRKTAGTDNEYQVFFFEAVKQSPTESVVSHETIVTETTITDSPSRKPKRRKLLLKSAQNKVKPVDKISLWEEIRTMEALNKTKQDSSSSLESYFKDVIVYKKNTEPEEDLISVGSFDVPPQAKPPSRFPSITRITKFCSSIFRKKSQTIVEESIYGNSEPMEDLEQKERSKQKNKRRVTTPKAAHMLLNVRKEQDLDVDFDRLTPSNENYSERSTVDDEDDSYYEGMCQICFCF